MELAQTYIAAEIRKHYAEHRNLDVPREAIVKAVARAKAKVEGLSTGVKKEAKTEERTRRLKEAKETLKNGKRPQPPKGRGTPVSVPRPPTKEGIPKGKSPIDARIDQFIFGD